MATIFGVTSLELTNEQEKALSEALTRDLSTMYTHALSFYLNKVPQENVRSGAVDQITFFVCVPPYISLEKKRQTIELHGPRGWLQGRDEGDRPLPVP